MHSSPMILIRFLSPLTFIDLVALTLRSSISVQMVPCILFSGSFVQLKDLSGWLGWGRFLFLTGPHPSNPEGGGGGGGGTPERGGGGGGGGAPSSWEFRGSKDEGKAGTLTPGAGWSDDGPHGIWYCPMNCSSSDIRDLRWLICSS